LVHEKYSSWDWNFGHSPKYSLTNELKYPGGNVEFNLNVEKGIIKENIAPVRFVPMTGEAEK
ncbi:MAG: lipoate protein ligase C-terminal domain-containing protein, partial [bacterium]